MKNVAIILVQPENSDNIGAAARAMKNMGFTDLRLVKPPENWRVKGRTLAVNAKDVLAAAKEFPSLKAAVADLQWVAGTSRRRGSKRTHFIEFDEVIQRLRPHPNPLPQAGEGKSKKATPPLPLGEGGVRAGVVFGRESKGLSNADLSLCDGIVSIPASPIFPSINLAQAVMIFMFSLYRAAGDKTEIKTRPPVPKKDVEEVLGRIEAALEILGYPEEGGDATGRILATFRGLFRRSGLIESEAQMLRGLTRRISEKIPKRDKIPHIRHFERSEKSPKSGDLSAAPRDDKY